MDITLDKSSTTEASIKIKLNEADYQPKVEQKIKEYSKKATLKGFRPGKVPSALIKKMYGKSILVDELNHLLSHSLNDYIKKQDLKIIGDPLPKEKREKEIDWENQKEFEFEYEVGLVGDFKYDLSKKIVKYEISVDDKTVDETIENIRNQYGQTINPDSSEDKDYLYGELSQKNGEIQRETVIALFEIDKKEKKKFIGVKPGDEVEFDIRKAFKEDRLIGLVTGKKTEEAKDIKGDFVFKISKIDRRVPAELGQDLYDRLFGKDAVKDEKAFREKIVENLKDGYEKEGDNYLNRQIREKLLEETKVELPDNFLKRWLKATNQNVSDEQIEKEFDDYIRELKWSLIRNKIAEDHEVKVEHEDVLNEAKGLIRNYLKSSGMPEEQLEENIDKFAESYMKAEDGKNYMNLYEQVRNEKTIAVVKENINVSSKKVTAEEFRKITTN